MTSEQQKKLRAEVDGVVASLSASHGSGKWKKMLKIKDAIADITLQQVLTRPEDFDVIGARTNLRDCSAFYPFFYFFFLYSHVAAAARSHAEPER